MKLVSMVVRSDGSFTVHSQEEPIAPVDSFAAGHAFAGDPDAEVKVQLSEHGARCAPLERRRLIVLAVRNLLRLLRT